MEPETNKEKPVLNPKPSWIDRLATRKGMVYLACFSLALLILTGLGVWYFFHSGPWVKITDLKFTPPPSLNDLATQYPELGTILLDPKLDSVYKDFLVAYQDGGLEAAYDLARKRGLVTEQDELRLTLELDTTESSAIVVELEQKGIIVTAASSNLIDILIPSGVFEGLMQSGGAGDFLESLSGLDHVVKIRLPIPDKQGDHLKMGNVESESLPVINAYAWHEAGFTGKGIKVAILDLGFDKYKSMLGTDLPNNVTTRSFIYGKEIDNTGIHHGTACAEIVHDVAPDAELILAAFSTRAEWYQAVEWLISQGVSIISFSAGSNVGSMDGNEDRAHKVDEIVSSNIMWISAAGNEANVHYRGSFTDEDGDGYHEFTQGDETIDFYSYGEEELVLNWDAWDTGDQDFDLYLLDNNYNEIASSRYVQDGSEKDAAEVITFDLPYEGTYYASIFARRVTRPAVLDFFAVYALEIEYPVAEHSLCSPGDARKALTVGATNWKDDSLEDFSSHGPTTDGRLKPELTAPDRVSSAAYGKAFPGTSASTPHVAGAAALVRQAYPDYTAEQVAEFLESRAIDLGQPGPDNAYGFGRLYLGDPPSEISMLPPNATPIVLTQSPEATSTTTKLATRTPQKTATPEPVSDVDDSNIQILALLGCVVLPGVFSIGGIGLLGSILYRRRSHSQTNQGKDWYPSVHVKPPATTPEPWKQQDIRGGPDIHQKPSPLGRRYVISQTNEVKIVCPLCGKQNNSQARFCTGCGSALRQNDGDRSHGSFQLSQKPAKAKDSCIYCGHKLHPNSKFCSNCGKPTQ